ncbi:MAG: class I SAM-dependent methyltransferase [Verrucomicrobiota bacterium JB023]|nr:class I SAM-dependent methyltransferase [Verrucomicrobiota bacterium JB023]
MKRIVEPEILDTLSRQDPRAIRSRRDLRLINLLMGNERWILRKLKELNFLNSSSSLIELGAGDGKLCQGIVRASSGSRVTGMDLRERPAACDERVSWVEGDIFESLPRTTGEVVVGSLILHHFQADALQSLGNLLKTRRAVLFAEPYRASWSLLEGYALWPLIGEVTKNDMLVSIRAGFRRGELPALLGLDEAWHWEERVTSRGAIRILGRNPEMS